MRFLFLLLFIGLKAYGNDFVRVRLVHQPNGHFIITGKIHRLQGLESAYKDVAIPQNQELNLRYEGRWVAEGFKKFPLVINKDHLIIEGSEISVNGKRTPDKIIIATDKGAFDLIGVIPMETYVVGVVAHEMPNGWPLETLKAQAIAARSYAVAVRNERKNKTFHLESTILDQVYATLSEDELKLRYGKVLEAVKQTEGYVLLNSKQKVLKAYYHADCGGQTASAKDVWNTKDELVSVTDESCPQNPKAQWNLRMEDTEIAGKLKSFAPPGGKKIVSLTAVPQGDSPRISSVEVEWDKGTKTTISAQNFREAIGFFELKSTQFKLQQEGTAWKFEGLGFGHGVGLCQWGSRALGKQGADAKSILHHYYPMAQLKVFRNLKML
jgi:stage II sporulation protein D